MLSEIFYRNLTDKKSALSENNTLSFFDDLIKTTEFSYLNSSGSYLNSSLNSYLNSFCSYLNSSNPNSYLNSSNPNLNSYLNSSYSYSYLNSLYLNSFYSYSYWHCLPPAHKPYPMHLKLKLLKELKSFSLYFLYLLSSSKIKFISATVFSNSRVPNTLFMEHWSI